MHQEYFDIGTFYMQWYALILVITFIWKKDRKGICILYICFVFTRKMITLVCISISFQNEQPYFNFWFADQQTMMFLYCFHQPMRACILGPPAAGKTTVIKQLCKHYKLHHIAIKDVIDQAIETLVSSFKLSCLFYNDFEFYSHCEW